MQEIIFSPKQYRALLERLDNIKRDVLLIKFKTGQETVFIDNLELSELLHVTLKTLTRWRKEKRLPYLQLNSKVFYRVDVLLDRCILKPEDVAKYGQFQQPVTEPDSECLEMRCKWCPLFILLNM